MYPDQVAAWHSYRNGTTVSAPRHIRRTLIKSSVVRLQEVASQIDVTKYLQGNCSARDASKGHILYTPSHK